MSGLEGQKLSFSDFRKILAYVWEERIEPKTVETKEQASIFNKREQMTARLLGLRVYHTWQIGDLYYEFPIRAREGYQPGRIAEILVPGGPPEDKTVNNKKPKTSKQNLKRRREKRV